MFSLPVAELSEDWSTVREPVIEGVPFYVKYLGSSIVQKASGEEATADAIKTIIAMVRPVIDQLASQPLLLPKNNRPNLIRALRLERTNGKGASQRGGLSTARNTTAMRRATLNVETTT